MIINHQWQFQILYTAKRKTVMQFDKQISHILFFMKYLFSSLFWQPFGTFKPAIALKRNVVSQIKL